MPVPWPAPTGMLLLTPWDQDTSRCQEWGTLGFWVWKLRDGDISAVNTEMMTLLP